MSKRHRFWLDTKQPFEREAARYMQERLANTWERSEFVRHCVVNGYIFERVIKIQEADAFPFGCEYIDKMQGKDDYEEVIFRAVVSESEQKSVVSEIIEEIGAYSTDKRLNKIRFWFLSGFWFENLAFKSDGYVKKNFKYGVVEQQVVEKVVVTVGEEATSDKPVEDNSKKIKETKMKFGSLMP